MCAVIMVKRADRNSISRRSKPSMRPLGLAAKLLANSEKLEAYALSARLLIESENE